MALIRAQVTDPQTIALRVTVIGAKAKAATG
jgi:hypothetical protein